ncbi:Sensor histidine kinase YesM [Salinibacillus kushneri]|uniref:Sensor histidine kinase YesM n=1 Tax=Salinibacillus kushneri TaxID=237682 RepID=A0A1H9YU39_9BACI|nr:histidine kinase [Salinibacillus kushneri]SES72682.1 Sensor histidine kinase YesM [Salinibacillus kushneri]
MKSIRSKLMAYFFVFVLLFNVVSVLIYFSSDRLLNEYHTSIERFLILNRVSQKSIDLYDKVNQFVLTGEKEDFNTYYHTRKEIIEEKNRLKEQLTSVEETQLDKHIHMIETLVQETEMTAGFVLQNDLEQYTHHLQEARETSNYIQETTLQLIDLELTEYQDFYQELAKRNEAFRSFTIFLFLTTVFLAIGAALWFSRGINRPIRSLWHTAREVSSGKLDGPDIEITSNDELKLLGNTFNQMRTNIQGLFQEIKEKSELDRLLKELELKHLQNQINPHFLFNTLNTVARMSYLEDATSTTRLIESISTILRHSLGDLDKSVVLRDEVKIVEEYFYIQKTRFADRMTFTQNIDESCLDLPVPRLTLQPLVENAFIHGIEKKEDGGMISLCVYRQGQTVMVEISDNGVGMTTQQKEGFLNLSHKDHQDQHVGHSTGLGLKNVIRRLQLFYQEDDVIEIDTKAHAGTTIRLKLPEAMAIRKGGEGA